MGYDANEFNLLPRGSRDGAFLRRPDRWPDLDFLAVPLPAISEYRAIEMRYVTRDDARVLREAALANWVVANLCDVAVNAWEGHLLHVPDAMLAYFQQVDRDWFRRHAKFTTI